MPTNPINSIVIDALDDLKAQAITTLDVTALTTITDTMVICTGTSNRHVKALSDHVIEQAKTAGYKTFGIEGDNLAEWILVDLGDVVVHIMQAKAREFYHLEKLWGVTELEENLVN